MKIAAIIAEYNPFHNGHNYHLERTRELTGADYIIAVLSGDFVQRGMPAVIDKYARAEMALGNGVDLALELPAVYAAGSAEFFAMGAVSLLDKLGCIDFLCFGSECGRVEPLSRMASLLLEEPEAYRIPLQRYLKAGHSFPKARSLALQDALSGGPPAKEAPSQNSSSKDAISRGPMPQKPLPQEDTSIEPKDNSAASPNNILGVEYIKALQRRRSAISPLTVQREGSPYHDMALDGPQCPGPSGRPLFLSSASAIREHISAHGQGDLENIKGHVPENVFRLLGARLGKTFPVNSQDFSTMLFYKLLLEKEKGFSHYQDMAPALSDKIRKNLNRYKDFEQFCGLLKSKDITYSRISRCLLHILLDMEEERLQEYTGQDFIFYARILGFRKSSAPLLAAIKANASIPLISKLADARFSLNAAGLSMLEKDIQASHIYSSAVSAKFGHPFANEYARPLVILS